MAAALPGSAVWSPGWREVLHGDYARFVAQSGLDAVTQYEPWKAVWSSLDERHLAHALVVLLTVAGTPSIYAGDEQAFRGVKEDRAGGDDAVRPAFPDDPDELSELGRPTYRLHQELIGLRRRHRWLHDARTHVLHLTNEQLAYEAVADEGRLVVALITGDTSVEVPAPGAGAVLAGSATVSRPSSPSTRARLAPQGWAVLAG